MASDPTSKRVRQSDRDDVVDALSSAFADGQITAKDHERRVGTALRARRESVLTNLLRDIRLPDGHPARELVEPPREATPVPPLRPRERRRLPGLAAGAGLAVAGGVALLVVVGVVDTVTDDSGDPAPTVLSAQGIAKLVDDVDEEFGTTEVIAVDFKQTWADVLVPAEPGSGRYLRYTYSADDAFSESQGGTLGADDPALVDLADLDVEELMDNVEQARTDLGVDDVTEVTAIVTEAYGDSSFSTSFIADGEDAPPHVEIEVGNEFRETAWVATDLGGTRELARNDFE